MRHYLAQAFAIAVAVLPACHALAQPEPPVIIPPVIPPIIFQPVPVPVPGPVLLPAPGPGPVLLPVPGPVVLPMPIDPRVPPLGLLKVCKIGGPGIATGTPFTFTAGGATFAVPSGPAPGGTCVVGPSFPVGTRVAVTETIPTGFTVSNIDVKPSGRQDGMPNLAGGSVSVTIGTGVTEVTFTDKRTGFLEVCKNGEVAGNFSFTVNPGSLGPYVVPAGACSPAIEVAAGTVTIHELPSAGTVMSGCSTLPPAQQGPCNVTTQTSTVTVVPGDISTMTIAFITNKKDVADISIDKKFTPGPERTGTFVLVVKNNGAAMGPGTSIPAPVIKVTDTVPLGMSLTALGATSAADWSCTPPFSVNGPNTLNCTYIGTPAIAAGATLPALVLNALLAADGSQTGIYGNCANVSLATAGGPVTESNTDNNRACTVTTQINPAGCETGKCPQPVAACKQDVVVGIDASVSIGGNLQTVKNAIAKFLQPMQNKGGSVHIFSFNNGGIGTSNPSWTQITTGTNGWVPVTAANWSTLANPIVLGGARTNWDDALRHASIVAPTAPLSPQSLVMLLTDGKPTAFIDNNTNLEVDATSTPVTAATEAVQWINAMRAAGSPVIAVGFGPEVSAGYLDAAFTGNVSGPGNVNFETSSVIKMGSANDLPGVMAALGNQMCSTLSLNKRVTAGPTFGHVIPVGTTSLSVSDTIPFAIDVTNNSAVPITNVVIQDKVPNVLANVVPGTPTLGGATVAAVGTANLITWTIPALPARQSATLSFTGKFNKTYTAPAFESYTNYAQVTGATSYNATGLNNMDADVGPVREPDEGLATFNVQIINPPPDLCLAEGRPPWCYLAVSKVRKFPGAEDGSCTSSPAGGQPNPCTFSVGVAISPTYVPAGATVMFSDTYTVGGTATSVPLNPPVPTAMCPSATPAAIPFNCSHGSLNNFSGDLTVMIPAGQTGAKVNCFSVTITNTSPALSVSQQSCVGF